jgi:hypothetical protein
MTLEADSQVNEYANAVAICSFLMSDFEDLLEIQVLHCPTQSL